MTEKEKTEAELYAAFCKARAALWEAQRAWEDYLNKKLKTPEYQVVTNQVLVNCQDCGKPYFSIPRLGIFHYCEAKEGKLDV